MTPSVASALLPLLRRIDPERAHDCALRALRLGLAGSARRHDDPILAVEVLGRHFANPVGLAAGFDKNAVAVRALMRLGFGFVETGTVTPRPQPGNPRPRLFRLDADQAVINRMGFNNDGLDAYVARLAAPAARRQRRSAPMSASTRRAPIPSAITPRWSAAVAPYADYVVINVSSPNTPGLRDLQGEAQLRAILRAVGTRAAATRPPMLVKIAPDLSDDGLAAVVETCVADGVQGLIVSNTTISRPAGLLHPARRASRAGCRARRCSRCPPAMLARAFLLARGRLVLVGVGGVAGGADA